MVFMPPRHGKSQLISEYFTAWYLGTFPDSRVILASYQADFARSWGRKSRDVLKQWGMPVFGVRIRDDSNAADSWNIAGHTGGMDTAGVGGPMTGKGARLMLIDDPLKNWQDAQSQVIKDAQEAWYESTSFTRLTPDGRQILVMTRWAEDDLAGRLLAKAKAGGPQWHVINFPAIAEESDALGRLPGDPLAPELGFNLERLQDIKATVSPKIWVSLYQQRPAPLAGDKVKLEYLSNRYDPNTIADKSNPYKLQYTIQTVDSAFETGVDNDYSVIATWAKTANGYYLLRIWRGKVEYPDLVQKLKDEYHAMRPIGVYIEAKASGKSAIQTIRRDTAIPVVGYNPKGNKLLRLTLQLPKIQGGRVWLPEYADWLTDWIDEHLIFPSGAHDDQVDTTSMALDILETGGVQYTDESVMDMPTTDTNGYYEAMAALEALG